MLLLPAWCQAQWVTPASSPAYVYGNAAKNLQITSDGSIWNNCLATRGMGQFELVVYTSADDGQSWRQTNMNSGNTQNGLGTGFISWDLWALSRTQAWTVFRDPATRRQELLMTTTGPQGFVPAPNNPDPNNLQYVRFFSSTEGVALAGSTTTTWGLYYTTDGGNTWLAKTVAAPTGTGRGFTACEVVGNSIWAVTAAGNVIFSHDRGQTWGSANTGLAGTSGVAFRDALHGLAYISSNPAQISRTTDGGQTWTPVAVSGPIRTIKIAALTSQPNTYLSVGTYNGNGNIGTGSAISTDDGLTWRNLESAYDHDGLAVGGNSVWATNVNANSPGMLMRLDATVLSSRAAQSPARLVAYPNPTSGPVQVAAVAYPRQATCYDAVGRVVAQQTVAAHTQTLDLSACPAGIYRVRLLGPDNVPGYLRVVKE